MDVTRANVEALETTTFSSRIDRLGWFGCRVTGPLALLVVTMLPGPDSIFLAVPFAVGSWVVLGAPPPEVWAGPTGLVVRNPLRTYWIPWSEVTGVRVDRFFPAEVSTPVRDVRCSALRAGARTSYRVERAAEEIYHYRRAVRAAEPGPDRSVGVTWSWSARPLRAATALAVVLITMAVGVTAPLAAVLADLS